MIQTFTNVQNCHNYSKFWTLTKLSNFSKLSQLVIFVKDKLVSIDFFKFGQVWTSVDKFEQVWSRLDKLEQVWTSLDNFGQVWTSLDMLELIWWQTGQQWPRHVTFSWKLGRGPKKTKKPVLDPRSKISRIKITYCIVNYRFLRTLTT